MSSALNLVFLIQFKSSSPTDRQGLSHRSPLPAEPVSMDALSHNSLSRGPARGPVWPPRSPTPNAGPAYRSAMKLWDPARFGCNIFFKRICFVQCSTSHKKTGSCRRLPSRIPLKVLSDCTKQSFFFLPEKGALRDKRTSLKK